MNRPLATLAPLLAPATMPSLPPSPQTAPPPAATADASSGIAMALGRVPSGLFVISWREGGTDRAMLASWVMQAGFAPPAVSVALAHDRDLCAAVARGEPFAVSVLAEAQRPLLARFGKPATDAFAGVDVQRTPAGLATLAAAAGWLECRPAARAVHGDHVVVVAEVVAGGGAAAEPLVHVRKNGLRY